MTQESKVVLTGGGRAYAEFDDDVAMTANDDLTVPTQKAVKAYVDAGIPVAFAAYMAGVINPNGEVFAPAVVTVSGVEPTASFIQLNHATVAIELTAMPTAGRFLVITQADAGTVGHTVTLSPGTFDGTNDVATFNAPGETLVLFGLSNTRYAIVLNLGAVGLS